jgi:hypothetical protein
MQLKEIKEMLLLQRAEKTASASATSIGNDFGLRESDGACEDTPVKGFGAFSEAPPPQEANSGDAATCEEREQGPFLSFCAFSNL